MLRSSLARFAWQVVALAAVQLGVAPAALASDPEEGHEGIHHRHHVAVFLGGAVRDEHETESGFAGGVDYEYRFTRLLGAGLLVEVATGGLREVLLAVPVALHPWRGLRFVAAPGAEIPGDGEAEFAMRLGVGYQVPVGRFTVEPGFNADLIDGTPTYVVGVSFGIGF